MNEPVATTTKPTKPRRKNVVAITVSEDAKSLAHLMGVSVEAFAETCVHKAVVAMREKTKGLLSPDGVQADITA